MDTQHREPNPTLENPPEEAKKIENAKRQRNRTNDTKRTHATQAGRNGLLYYRLPSWLAGWLRACMYACLSGFSHKAPPAGIRCKGHASKHTKHRTKGGRDIFHDLPPVLRTKWRATISRSRRPEQTLEPSPPPPRTDGQIRSTRNQSEIVWMFVPRQTTSNKKKRKEHAEVYAATFLLHDPINPAPHQ